MPALTKGVFVCDACFKQHAWRAAWAGKQAKCPCGHVMTVPAEPQEPEVMYDFAMPEGPQPVKSMTVFTPAVALPVDEHGRPKLGYQSAANLAKEKAKVEANLLSPRRDIYVPVGLLTAGLLMYVVWVVRLGINTPSTVAQLSAVLTVVVVLKTAALIGVAFAVASVVGTSFGTFWTAALKLAAVVVFADFSILWIDHFVGTIGIGVGAGTIAIRLIGVLLLLEACLYGVALYFLFEIDADEVFGIAAAMAFASRVVGIVAYSLLS
jgi:hypothetical protein